MTKILIELVPKTCWFTNIRSQVSTTDWDLLRKEAYKKYNHQCSICKKKGRMEAHEIWHYDDKNKIQKLFEIVSVCNQCHQLYHLGFSSINGNFNKSKSWLKKINNWTEEETIEYINIVFEIWNQRSQHHWDIDLSFLDQKGINYKAISKEERFAFLKKSFKEMK